MEQNKTPKKIDFTKIAAAVYRSRKTFYIALPIAFIMACLLIISVPRYYKCETKLSPETIGTSSSLSSIAASMGMNIGSIGDMTDAIFPEIYPDLIKSVNFKVSLFDIKVKNSQNTINTSYYEYLKSYQKYAWWTHIKSFVINLFDKESEQSQKTYKVNSFMLTKTQTDIVGLIEEKIGCSVDKKTQVITITVEDQDPLVCAIVTDSVRAHLQQFITAYRTNKARTDLEYMKKLYTEAKRNYEKSRQRYAAYCDANTDVNLQAFISKKNDLENDMQLQFNTYSNIVNQLHNAKAKVQERTPAFTMIQTPTVPLKPAGPKRMLFVLAVVFVTFVITTLYVARKEIF